MKYPVHIAFVEALEECWVITRGTLEALGQMIMGSRSAAELGGVIRIGALAGDMAQQGLIALIMFTALLSINLGLINLFQYRCLMADTWFSMRLRQVWAAHSEQIQEYAFRVGFVFLIGLMAFCQS